MKILARIPEDNGKKIVCDHEYTATVEETECEWCEMKNANSDDYDPNLEIPFAVVVVEGERDSFGREIHFICAECLKKG